MGAARWSSDSWSSYSSTTSTKPASAIFTKHSLHEDLDPTKFTVRESRDSDLNPLSTAIMVGVDVTGSMGRLSDYFVKTGLGILFEEILDRKPVTDPHLMVLAIGDVVYDSAPIQASQFEADITIAQHLEKIYVEQGGGGNSFESYDMPYYIAANKTSIDCFEKRGKKGYLFTIGDEPPPEKTTKEHITKFTGDTPQGDIYFKDLIEQTQKMYNCYHIIVAERGTYAGNIGFALDRVKTKWVDLLGQNVIVLTDSTKLSEVIVSIMEINEGADIDTVTSSWSGDTSLVVRSAVSGLSKSETSTDTGIIRL
jgi:hypothetical protein